MILVAPDKFKGTLTASQVAHAAANALRAVYPAEVVLERPIADGGEGTVDLALATGMQPIDMEVRGPLGVPTVARYAVDAAATGRGRAVIEIAAACGLTHVRGEPDASSAADASTFGVGQLINDAVDRGCRTIVLGLGGSATTDGGIGMALALGAVVRTRTGRPVASGGGGLAAIDSVDLTPVIARLSAVTIHLATDVDNPLLGPHGAAAVYGPQKGADDVLVSQLDANLAAWAAALHAATGRNAAPIAGAGAAGGCGMPLLAAGLAQVHSGADMLMDLAGLNDLFESTNLLVVGEGSLDRQSLRGKGPVAAALRAQRYGAEVVAIVGVNTLSPSELGSAGIDRVYAMTDVELDRHRCLAEPVRVLGELVVHMAESERRRTKQ